MTVSQVLSFTLALCGLVRAEPDAQALLGDDQCEGDGQCALSALQRRGVRREEEFKVEAELSSVDSMEAERLPVELEQVDEEVQVNYTYLQTMGCFAKPAEYRLSWRAAGRDFFDQFTFVEEDDTHGAQKYLSKRQAFNDKVISISSSGSAILRVGELVATGDPGAPYKRNSVMIHSNYAWTPSTGMLVVMKYNHVPYGASIWPAFWLMNSDNIWPKGGEFDIMEYANDEASKITFHADRNCVLDNRKLGYCMRGKHMGGPGPSNCNTNYWKNLFGCRPRQVQKTGHWYATNPGVIAAAWDDDGITVYHIPEHRIPADLKDDKPRPEGWGEFAVAYLPMEHHSCKDIAQPQEIVLNIALCGDWAGNGWFRSGEARGTGFTHGCGPLIFEPTKDCCTRFATSRDHRIEDMFRKQAYFDIDYLKVFSPVHAPTPQTSGVKRRRGQLLH
eukprot:symbB.v1.2.002449.t1/scaffold99.1/size346285/5